MSEDTITKIIQLPYTFSKVEVEEIFQLIADSEASPKVKEYFQNKYENKHLWCLAFKTNLPCLKINTTSRIEGLNNVIKKELNASTRLMELVYRLMLVGSNILQNSYPDLKQVDNQLYESLENNIILARYKHYLSKYAFRHMTPNLSRAFNYEVKLYAGIYKVSDENENERKIKKLPTMDYTCSYYLTIGVPCAHLISIALKDKLTDLKGNIRERWLKANDSASLCDDVLVIFIKRFLQRERQEGRYYQKIE